MRGGAPTLRRMAFRNQAEQVMYLRRLVNHYTANQLIREKAHQIVFDEFECASKDKLCHALAIGTWVQENVTYVNEGFETFQTPVRTLTYRLGDCDDFTTLICSMLESIGIRSELVALEWRGQYRHIFPRALIPRPGGATVLHLPLDATLNQPIRRATDPVLIAVRRGDNPRTLVL